MGTSFREILGHRDSQAFRRRESDLNLNKSFVQDAAVRDVLTGAWAAFARSGDPGLGWAPLSDQTIPTFLNISGPNPIMDSSQNLADRMMVWQTVVG